jgi:hypothetical protein
MGGGFVMNFNVGSVDKWVRFIVWSKLFRLISDFHGDLWCLGLVGIVPAATGPSGIWPRYMLPGMNTCPEHDSCIMRTIRCAATRRTGRL